MRIEEREHLDACLASLPAAQREAVRLRYYEELSIAVIVERMGRSETAVAGLLKRGLSGLRDMLRES